MITENIPFGRDPDEIAMFMDNRPLKEILSELIKKNLNKLNPFSQNIVEKENTPVNSSELL